jgi:hypothetical protein
MKRALEDEIEDIREELGDDCTVDRLLMELASARFALAEKQQRWADMKRERNRWMLKAMEAERSMAAHAEAVEGDPSMGSPVVLGADQGTKRPMAKAAPKDDTIAENVQDALDGITETRISVHGAVSLVRAVASMDIRERREAHDQDLMLRRLELVERFLDRDLAGWNAEDAPGPLAGFAKVNELAELADAVLRLSEMVAGQEKPADDTKVVVESDGHCRKYDVSKVDVTCAGVKVDPCGDVLVFPPESCVGCPWYWTNPALIDKGWAAVCGKSRPPGPRLVNPTSCERHPDWPSKGSGGDGQ